MTGRRRGTRFMTLALALLGTLACRGTSTVADLKDPCTIVSDDDIAEVLHLKVDERRSEPETVSFAFAGERGSGDSKRTVLKDCTITATNRGSRLQAMVFQVSYGTPVEFRDKMATTARASSGVLGPGEPLPGIGDEAFWNAAGETAGVKRGMRVVLISGMPDRATARALIAKAAYRLP
jgi:hypothetical protein